MTTASAGELIQESPKHRRAVVRQAVLYTPGAIVVLGVLGISLSNVAQGRFGALIPAVILALVAISLTFQAVAALRDLLAQPTSTTGEIRRAWTKGMWFGLFRTYHVLVRRSVFDVSVVAYAQVQEGDRLEVAHWPHSKTVISVRKLPGENVRTSGPDSGRTVDESGSVDAAITRMQGTTTFGGPLP